MARLTNGIRLNKRANRHFSNEFTRRANVRDHATTRRVRPTGATRRFVNRLQSTRRQRSILCAKTSHNRGNHELLISLLRRGIKVTTLFNDFRVPIHHRLLTLCQLAGFIMRTSTLYNTSNRVPFFRRTMFPNVLRRYQGVQDRGIFTLTPTSSRQTFPLSYGGNIQMVPRRRNRHVTTTRLNGHLLRYARQIANVTTISRLCRRFNIHLALRNVTFYNRTLLRRTMVFGSTVIRGTRAQNQVQITIRVTKLTVNNPTNITSTTRTLYRLLHHRLFPRNNRPSFTFCRTSTTIRHGHRANKIMPTVLRLFRAVRRRILHATLASVAGGTTRAGRLRASHSHTGEHDSVRSTS